MEIRNIESIPLVESFIHRFGNELIKIFEGKEIANVAIIGERTMFFDTPRIDGIMDEDEYFGVNGNLIGYRAVNVDKLNLTEEERFAMIAHEFGHIYHCDTDYGKDNETDFLKKEQDADEMACRLKLSEALISGLTTIMKKGKCNGGLEQMQQRIDKLTSN